MYILIAIISVILIGLACIGVTSLLIKKPDINEVDPTEFRTLIIEKNRLFEENERLKRELRNFIEFKGLKRGDKIYCLSGGRIKEGVVDACYISDPYGMPSFDYIVKVGEMVVDTKGFTTKEALIESLINEETY